jgi:hypothetical protein
MEDFNITADNIYNIDEKGLLVGGIKIGLCPERRTRRLDVTKLLMMGTANLLSSHASRLWVLLSHLF